MDNQAQKDLRESEDWGLSTKLLQAMISPPTFEERRRSGSSKETVRLRTEYVKGGWVLHRTKKKGASEGGERGGRKP